MQTSNGNQKIKSNIQAWILIGDYSLSEIAPDNDEGDELRAGFLFQPLRELNAQPERIENVEMTLEGFVKDALLMHYKHTRLELPWRIRVFCQKKVVDNANSAQTSMPEPAGHMLEQAPIKYCSSTIRDEGWGYFIIVKSDNPARSSESLRQFVDLYLYKEGD